MPTFNEDKFTSDIDAIKLEFKDRLDRFYSFANKLFGADNLEAAEAEVEKVLNLVFVKLIVSFEANVPQDKLKSDLHLYTSKWVKTNLLNSDPFEVYEVQKGLDFLVDALIPKLYAQLPVETESAEPGNAEAA